METYIIRVNGIEYEVEVEKKGSGAAAPAQKAQAAPAPAAAPAAKPAAAGKGEPVVCGTTGKVWKITQQLKDRGAGIRSRADGEGQAKPLSGQKGSLPKVMRWQAGPGHP